ncbi:MAG: hypothetical protein P4M05_24045 [Bradyrhizobium sp.]|nr:hypothetical protein [Bradyrhizobium sp.]
MIKADNEVLDVIGEPGNDTANPPHPRAASGDADFDLVNDDDGDHDEEGAAYGGYDDTIEDGYEPEMVGATTPSIPGGDPEEGEDDEADVKPAADGEGVKSVEPRRRGRPAKQSYDLETENSTTAGENRFGTVIQRLDAIDDERKALVRQAERLIGVAARVVSDLPQRAAANMEIEKLLNRVAQLLPDGERDALSFLVAYHKRRNGR